MRIPAAEIHHPIHHGSRRLNSDLIVDYVVLSSFEPPLHFPVRGIDSVEETVPTPHIKSSTRNRGGCMNDIAGLDLPLHCSRGRIHRIDIAIAAAEVHRSIPDDGGRQITIKRIWHGFLQRLRSMQMLAREPSLSARLKLPVEGALRGIQCIKIAV